jgi:hypothetical protein
MPDGVIKLAFASILSKLDALIRYRYVKRNQKNIDPSKGEAIRDPEGEKGVERDERRASPDETRFLTPSPKPLILIVHPRCVVLTERSFPIYVQVSKFLLYMLGL